MKTKSRELRTATDIKDFVLCPRIVWWRLVEGVSEPQTEMMEEGKLEHEEIQRKENHRRYFGKTLTSQRKLTEVYVFDSTIGFHGVIDSVLPSIEDGDVICEQKFHANTSKRLAAKDLTQVSLYALLWEAMYPERFVESLWIRYKGHDHMVDWDAALREQIIASVSDFHAELEKWSMPAPNKLTTCRSCWYSRQCWGARPD